MGRAPAARDCAHREEASGLVPMTRWMLPRQLRPTRRDVGVGVVVVVFEEVVLAVVVVAMMMAGGWLVGWDP